MKRAEFLARLAEGQAGPIATQRRCVHALRRHADVAWVDEAMREAAARLAEACGESWPQAQAPGLRVGEAWLLLLAPGARGDVVRLYAHPAGAHGGEALQRHAADALRGLRAAAAAARQFVPAEVMFQRLTVCGGAEGLDIDGRSLGLAACVAAVSRLLGRPPDAAVAGTAAVTTAGEIVPIGGIREKLEALRARAPRVTTVVVSRDQADVPENTGHHIRRVATLAEAMEPFGLTLDVGKRPTKQALQVRKQEVEASEVLPHSTAGWARLSMEGEAVGRDLLAMRADEGWDVLLVAGLLASHAGDSIRAAKLIDEVPEDGRAPRLLARKRIYMAAASIDPDPEAALVQAIDAVERCRALGPEDQKQWLGRALGTQGRVLLHRGECVAAEPLLRAAREHHADHSDDGPRSAIYLAQCLRHQGRVEEARDVARRAHGDAAACDTSDQSLTTQLYALLEMSRCELGMGRAEHAAELAMRVVEGQAELASYPRVGAHRTLVQAYRLVGDYDTARRHLRMCVDVTRTDSAARTLRKVGAVAAALELAAAETDASEPLLDPAELVAAWRRCFDERNAAEVLSFWVY